MILLFSVDISLLAIKIYQLNNFQIKIWYIEKRITWMIVQNIFARRAFILHLHEKNWSEKLLYRSLQLSIVLHDFNEMSSFLWITPKCKSSLMTCNNLWLFVSMNWDQVSFQYQNIRVLQSKRIFPIIVRISTST